MRTGLLSRANEGGLSMIAAAVDLKGMPACCRAVGVRISEDNASATVWVPVATSQALITCLAANPRVALVLSAPVSHETIQIKGPSQGVRLATADEQGRIDQQIEKLRDVLDQLGLPRRVTLRLNRWPAFAIEFTIEEVFDQTPGPKAGQVMR